MRVSRGDAVILQVLNPSPVPAECELYVELLADDERYPTPSVRSASAGQGLSNAASIVLADGILTAAAARARSAAVGATGLLLSIVLYRRTITGPGPALLLVSGHANGDEWISWTPAGAHSRERTPTKTAVNPVQEDAATLRWDVPFGTAARLTGFQLTANVVADPAAAVVAVTWEYAGLTVAASQSTTLLLRPSTTIVRGSLASLQTPAGQPIAVVPLPTSYAHEGTVIRVRIVPAAAGDTLIGNAFGVELVAGG